MKFYPGYILLFCLIPWFSYAQFKPKVLVLNDATIIDAGHPVPAMHQTVVIMDGRITRVFPTGTMAFPDSAVVISLKGKYLLPGLIDSHVHMATDPGGTDNRAHTLEVLRQMLYSGITTVRDMAGDARILAELGRDANEGEITSPGIYYSALMAGPSFFSDPRTQAATKGGIPGNMAYMKAITDTTYLPLAVAQAKGCGASGIKLYANLSGVLAWKIIDEAKRQNIPVWSHAWLQGAKPSDLVSAGCISISHAPLLIYEKVDKVPDFWKKNHHDAAFWDKAVPALDELFNEMKQHHTVFDATLLTYKKWAASDTSMQWDYEIAKRITSHAYRAGVAICAGTDDDQEQFVQDEMRVLITDASFSPFDAIVAATKNSAAALHLEAVKGSISPNMDADLLVLSRNPLNDIGNIKSVKMVIKGGRIYQK
ncbi:amidohydrolase family protein [Mucilaginibacter sp. OK098]|uniref:amidohydrolase family protein n=1 Tax=Mucilaginibacter sp. OK098 TaxID=1855297 RepID=UPI000914BDBE|nr:amidohydrolase family protein [Mucilaginibacter sp. OK098]SHM13969.1 Imidazolonepropionase [Mucilaginibacter sp. OK098]